MKTIKKANLKGKYGIKPTVEEQNKLQSLAVMRFITDEEIRFQTLENMDKYGGGFVQSLAECFRHADRVNSGMLAVCMSEYILEYSPEKWQKKE